MTDEKEPEDKTWDEIVAANSGQLTREMCADAARLLFGPLLPDVMEMTDRACGWKDEDLHVHTVAFPEPIECGGYAVDLSEHFSTNDNPRELPTFVWKDGHTDAVDVPRPLPPTFKRAVWMTSGRVELHEFRLEWWSETRSVYIER
jgi:hypothetical protein